MRKMPFVHQKAKHKILFLREVCWASSLKTVHYLYNSKVELLQDISSSLKSKGRIHILR